MQNNISNWIAIASFVVAIGSNVLWLLTEFQKNSQKQYIQERRFQELARNQKEILSRLDNLK